VWGRYLNKLSLLIIKEKKGLNRKLPIPQASNERA